MNQKEDVDAHQDPLPSTALLARWRSAPLPCSAATRLGARSGGDDEMGFHFYAKGKEGGKIPEYSKEFQAVHQAIISTPAPGIAALEKLKHAGLCTVESVVYSPRKDLQIKGISEAKESSRCNAGRKAYNVDIYRNTMTPQLPDLCPRGLGLPDPHAPGPPPPSPPPGRYYHGQAAAGCLPSSQIWPPVPDVAAAEVSVYRSGVHEAVCPVTAASPSHRSGGGWRKDGEGGREEARVVEREEGGRRERAWGDGEKGYVVVKMANWRRRHPGRTLEDYDRCHIQRHEDIATLWQWYCGEGHGHGKTSSPQPLAPYLTGIVAKGMGIAKGSKG
uniref:Uncharacterized protein n=1 Tax=Oryza punctata TaxID=4537 RepID=A0A0E0LIP9_ORYPU